MVQGSKSLQLLLAWWSSFSLIWQSRMVMSMCWICPAALVRSSVWICCCGLFQAIFHIVTWFVNIAQCTRFWKIHHQANGKRICSHLWILQMEKWTWLWPMAITGNMFANLWHWHFPIQIWCDWCKRQLCHFKWVDWTTIGAIHGAIGQEQWWQGSSQGLDILGELNRVPSTCGAFDYKMMPQEQKDFLENIPICWTEFFQANPFEKFPLWGVFLQVFARPKE